MPYFITLGRWTEQGIKNVKESPKRAAAAKALIERSGGKWLGIYYTFGEFDFVAITEQGSGTDESAMRDILAIGGQGSARTITLKAFSLSEAEKIFSQLP